MNPKLNTLLVALVTVTVGLAGCTDGNEVDSVVPSSSTDLVDKDSTNLGDKGAINGLLVDDNYRPVQLKEDWGNQEPGDFQDKGFILLLQTGDQLETTENGEFQVLGLDPGKYTLRVSADGHEAIDKDVEVEKGEFTDVNVLARRKASTNNQVLTQEFAVFIDCWIPFWTELNCFGDMSLDSKRAGFTSYMQALEGELSYIFTEFEFANSGNYDGDIGKCNGESFSGWGLSVPVRDSTYGSLIVTATQEQFEAHQAMDNATFEVAGALRGLEFCTVVWPQGQLAEYGQCVEGAPCLNYGLVGFGTSTKARIMQSAFIGLPEVDLAEYCVICPPE